LDQNDAIGRIGLELRVGITGHRSLAYPVQVAADVAIAIQRILAQQAVRGTDVTPIGLTIVSALAEGADRIAVEQARGIAPCRLEAVLPMAVDDYRRDFKTQESQDAFDSLLATASSTIVMGRSDDREVAYASAGQTIVERSDIVIAVWDGQPARGAGGTAAIVAYARERHRQLLWVHLDGTNRITSESDAQGAPEPQLPLPMSPRAFRELDRFNRRPLRPSSTSIPGFVPNSIDTTTASRLDDFVRWGSPYFVRAEANAEQSRGRAIALVTILYALAPIAVGLVAFELAFNVGLWLAWLETAVLIVISLILVALWRLPGWHWHENWIATRALAERIRSSIFLGVAGIGNQLETGTEAGGYATVGDEWLTRAFKEIWLQRPVTTPNRADVGAVQTLLDGWLTDQVHYHETAAARYERWRDVLRVVVLVSFGISVAIAFVHSLDPFGASAFRDWMGSLSVAIPAVAAAVSGYSGQREFGQLADRSRRMEVRLRATAGRLRLADSLDSIQALALTAEQQIRGETADWYSLVRLHKPDVPA
jgi:SMODS and SLOG-associating 2TM effector domain 1